MASTTGSYTLDELKLIPEPVVDFGEEALADAFQAELRVYNRTLTDMISLLMEDDTETIYTYGEDVDTGLMKVADAEFSRIPTTRTEGAYGTFNVPLIPYQDALGWTKAHIQEATVASLANALQAIENKDTRTLYEAIKKAFFIPTSYTVRDFTVKGKPELNVVRLVNGDDMPIPNGPDGETFDADTHTHYLANNGWTDAAVDAAIEHVTEHGHTGKIVVYISATNRSQIAALTKFEPLRAPELRYGANLTVAESVIDTSAPENNRQIGVWDGLYEVRTKPWLPAGYIFVHDVNGPKPLVRRRPAQPALQGLRLIFDIDIHPLRARGYENRYGLGVRQRTNGAIMYMGGASYTSPYNAGVNW